MYLHLLAGTQGHSALGDYTVCVCAGGSIDQLTVTCKGAYSRVLGLLRLGRKSGGAAGIERTDLSSSGHAST